MSCRTSQWKEIKQIPYSAMKTNTEGFIPDEYRPRGIIFQDPRNMNLHNIQKVLQHCYNRQAESGPESAFQFGKIVGSKRKQVLAKYPGSSKKRVGRNPS